MSDNNFYFSDYYDTIPVEHWYDGFYDDSESSYDYYDDYSSEWGYYGDDSSSDDDESVFYDDDSLSYDEYSYGDESSCLDIKEQWPTYNDRYLPSYNGISFITHSVPEFNFHKSDFLQLSTSNIPFQSKVMEILTNTPIVEHLSQYLESYTLALTCNTFLPLYSNWEYYRPSFTFKIPGLPIQRNRVASFSIKWNAEVDHFINISVSAA